MKKWILLCTTSMVLLMACKDEKKSTTTEGEQKMATLALPASYSSSFEMGNPEYAATIVQGSWKDWQDNKLDNMRNWMADTIVAFHSSNTMVNGLDSMMAMWKRDRAEYSLVLDTVNAAMAVYSTDKKENWVLVWATEINSKPGGAMDTIELMETWRMNKDGKADLLLQYERRTKK